MSDNQLFLSLPTEKLLAITAYGEAGGEGAEGMMAVLNVIRNRTADLGQYADQDVLNTTGDPYKAVILKSKQFSMFNVGDPVRVIAERLATNFDSEAQTNLALGQAYSLSQMLLQGTLADNTGGADHYHATYVTPSWAALMPVTGQIGNHIFYASGIISQVTQQVTQFVSENPFTALLVGGGAAFLFLFLKRRSL